MVYISNRYGVEVTGTFTVDSMSSDEAVTSVSGSGSVETDKFPHVDQRRQVRVGTGEKHFFGLGPEKTQLVDTDEFEVDEIFRQMIRDYRAAYMRFYDLLQSR